jgi:hypothetical protein
MIEYALVLRRHDRHWKTGNRSTHIALQNSAALGGRRIIYTCGRREPRS